MTKPPHAGESAPSKAPSSTSLQDGDSSQQPSPEAPPGLARLPYNAVPLSKGKWLEGHRSPSTITASEVSTILGVNPYKSAFTLYHEKVGELPYFEGNISTRAGHALEPLIAHLYE